MTITRIGFTGHRDRHTDESGLDRIAATWPGAVWVHGGAIRRHIQNDEVRQGQEADKTCDVQGGRQVNDIKIAIIGRKAGGYLDDTMLTDILALLERHPDDVKRAILYRLLQAAHRNGMKEVALEFARKGENIYRNMGFVDSFDYQTFLVDAPATPPEDEMPT